MNKINEGRDVEKPAEISAFRQRARKLKSDAKAGIVRWLKADFTRKRYLNLILIFITAAVFCFLGFRAAQVTHFGDTVEIVVINDPNTPEQSDINIPKENYRFDPRVSVLYIDWHGITQFSKTNPFP